MEKENVFDKQHAKLFDIAGNVHLEDRSKQVCCLKQTCLPTGAARKYLTTVVGCHLCVSLNESHSQPRRGSWWDPKK